MTKLPRAIITSTISLLSAVSPVFAQTATNTATTSGTKGGLPAAGDPTMTIVIVTISTLVIVFGAIKFFRSFR